MKTTNPSLLDIQGLGVTFDANKPFPHCALAGVSLSVEEGEVVALVGESGSGKTVLAHSILGLLPRSAKITSGQILWRGVDVLPWNDSQLRQIRGKEVAMIFQDAQASLNPVYPVGRQLLWRLELYRSLSGISAKNEALNLLKTVRLSDPQRVFGCYPHELSGGMCQRVMIAMAIACRPSLLIADEPTSSLDATIQFEIMTLIKTLQQEYRMAVLFITHNMSLLRGFCSRVTVMQGGKVVEVGTTEQLFTLPRADYTKSLLQASGLLDNGVDIYNSVAATTATSDKSQSFTN